MDAIEFRRHLHAHPELSFEEHRTAAFITEALQREGIGCRPIARTGVLATIEGRPSADRRTVVLRADIDALPITEQTGLEYASQNAGVMHACGHDIHAAVLFGVLKRLNAARDFQGTVIGVFQPGEECNPGGAQMVLAEKPFEGGDVRAVVGLHVEPQMAVGTLGFRAGKYMAASDELRFHVRGKGGHGAMRRLLHDPVAAAAELIHRLLAFNTEECVISLGRVVADGATNVVPDEVYIEGTLRTFDEQERKIMHRRIENVAADIDRRNTTSTEVDINHGYPCVVSDGILVHHATALASQNGYTVEMLPLRTTAEDFGFYCREYPSLFFRLGAGVGSGRSHTALFNPDEASIAHGIDFMESVARQILTR